MTAEEIASLQPELAALLEAFSDCFPRAKNLAYWRGYISGLLSDLKRKSIEPIALAAGVPVRTLQEFMAFFEWDHGRINDRIQRRVAARPDDEAIAILDGSGHPKQGRKTPGVQRQWCGQSGRIDNCVVGVHLLYTNNHAVNPFNCMLGSGLYLPQSWASDRPRCQKAGIPEDVAYRPKWKIATELLASAIGNGVRLSWVTADEEFGTVPGFWFELDRLGLRGVCEVRPDFHCWATPPICRSLRAEHSSRRVDNLAVHSPVFTGQDWQRIKVKDTTRGPAIWRVKSAQVQLVQEKCPDHRHAIPTDRRYWLIVAQNEKTGEVKYLVSNAAATVPVARLLQVAFARWHVEKWFERSKQQAGLGAFEVRTYTSLLRHWVSARMAMLFLAEQTCRLREKKSADHAGTDRRSRQPGGVERVEAMPALAAGVG